MGKNRSVNSQRTKEVVRYLYSLAKRKGYLENVMKSAGVTNIKSLQWSYTQGKISEEQIAGYVAVLGVDRDFITGVKEMTPTDQSSLEARVQSKIENSVINDITYEQVNNTLNEYDNYIEVYKSAYAVIQEENAMSIYKVIQQNSKSITLEGSSGQVKYENLFIFEVFEANSNDFFERLLAFIKNLKIKVNERISNIEKRKQTINYINALFTRKVEIIEFTNDYLCYIEQNLQSILAAEIMEDDITAQLYFMAEFTDFFNYGERLSGSIS